jgi:hypothetical protein
VKEKMASPREVAETRGIQYLPPHTHTLLLRDSHSREWIHDIRW